jgi:ketosteroid isomerase-like protein
MSASPPPSQLEIAQRLAAHLGHLDFDELTDLLSQDVTYRVGGNHPLAGIFRGPDEVVAHMRQLVDWTGNTFDAFKWEDWLVGDRHVAALVRIHAQAHAAVYAGQILVLFGFDSADRVCDITIFFEDAIAAERFFGQ